MELKIARYFAATETQHMTNKEIAYAFDDLANLMELHGEDEFRIRSYKNAYLALRKIDGVLAEMPTRK